MPNNSIQIPKVNFQPWIGKYYGERFNHFDRVRLLVLGESHYEDAPDENDQHPNWIVIKNSCGDQAFTHYVVNRWGKQFPHRFFTMVANVLLQRKQGGGRTQEHAEVWDHIAFYNYVSTLVSWELGQDRANRPNYEQWKKSKLPFENVLKELTPNAVLMLGADLSGWVSYNHKHHNFEETYQPYEDNHISFLGIRHPGSVGGVQYDKAIPSFQVLLKLAR